jgi:hypothetical protein
VPVLLSYALAIGLQELERFAATADLGPYAAVLGPYLDLSAVIREPSELLTDPDLREALRPVLEAALDYVGIVANGLLHAFVTFALAFYLSGTARGWPAGPPPGSATTGACSPPTPAPSTATSTRPSRGTSSTPSSRPPSTPSCSAS